MAGETPRQKKLKAYPIGSCHLDIAEVRMEEGKLSLFVAIDRSCNPCHDTLGLNSLENPIIYEAPWKM
jgi:hypothetical protein